MLGIYFTFLLRSASFMNCLPHPQGSGCRIFGLVKLLVSG